MYLFISAEVQASAEESIARIQNEIKEKVKFVTDKTTPKSML
jgi:hypothetical protein